MSATSPAEEAEPNPEYFHVVGNGYGYSLYVAFAQMINDARSEGIIPPSANGKLFETIDDLKSEMVQHIHQVFAVAKKYPASDEAALVAVWGLCARGTLEGAVDNGLLDEFDQSDIEDYLVDLIGSPVRHTHDYRLDQNALSALIAETCFKVKIKEYKEKSNGWGWVNSVNIRFGEYVRWHKNHNSQEVTLRMMRTAKKVSALIPKTNDAMRVQRAAEFAANDDARQANAEALWKLQSLLYDSGDIKFEGTIAEKILFARQLLSVGNPRAAFELANELMSGALECTNSYYEARRYFELAADLNHPEAKRSLAKWDTKLEIAQLVRTVGNYNQDKYARQLLELLQKDKSPENAGNIEACKAIIAYLEVVVLEEDDPRKPDSKNYSTHWAELIEESQRVLKIRNKLKEGEKVGEVMERISRKFNQEPELVRPGVQENTSAVAKRLKPLKNILLKINAALKWMGKELGILTMTDAEKIVSLSEALKKTKSVRQYRAVLDRRVKKYNKDNRADQNTAYLRDAANDMIRSISTTDATQIQFENEREISMQKLVFALDEKLRPFLPGREMDEEEASTFQDSGIPTSYSAFCENSKKKNTFTETTCLNARQKISEGRLQLLDWIVNVTDEANTKLSVVLDVSGSQDSTIDDVPVFRQRIQPGVEPSQNVKEFRLVSQAFLDNPDRIKSMLDSGALKIILGGSVLLTEKSMQNLQMFANANKMLPINRENSSIMTLKKNVEALTENYKTILHAATISEFVSTLIGSLNIISSTLPEVAPLHVDATLVEIKDYCEKLGVEGFSELQSIDDINILHINSLNHAAIAQGIKGATLPAESYRYTQQEANNDVST